MPLGMEVGLYRPRSRPHCFRWEPGQLSSPKTGTAPNFWPMSIVAKRLYIRIPLGLEVGLSLGDIVLDGDPAPLP